MRKIESSSTTWCRARLMVCALERSRPSGFSTTSRAPAAQPEPAEARRHLGEQARRDREVVAGARGAAERCCAARRTSRPRGSRRPPGAAWRRGGRARRDRSPSPCFARLSRMRSTSASRVVPPRATPTTTSGSRPRRSRFSSAGKIFLNARSPVMPKITSASLVPHRPVPGLGLARFASLRRARGLPRCRAEVPWAISLPDPKR